MADYRIVPTLDCATINDYVSLFADAFAGDKKLSAEYLGWQYLSNPHGRVIGMDAFIGDQLAAHYAVIPRRYRMGTQLFEAALSVNTATHPQHQGKGLFTRLAAATYELAAKRGVSFVVGAANANSVDGFTRKLGFLNLGQIRLYAAWRAVPRVHSDLDLDRSEDWIAWRLANPSRVYQLVQHRDGTATVRTRVKSVAFNIARLDSAIPSSRQFLAITANTESQLGWMPSLTPFFGSYRPPGLRLPLRAQASPWHMIWRALDPAVDSSLSSQLRFDGLAMDTF